MFVNNSLESLLHLIFNVIIMKVVLYPIPNYTFQCMHVSSTLMQVCFYISRLNYFQIFCATYSLVLMYVLNSFFLLFTSFTLILFIKFSIVFPYIALFVNFNNVFHLCHYFFCFYSFLRVELNM